MKIKREGFWMKIKRGLFGKSKAVLHRDGATTVREAVYCSDFGEPLSFPEAALQVIKGLKEHGITSDMPHPSVACLWLDHIEVEVVSDITAMAYLYYQVEPPKQAEVVGQGHPSHDLLTEEECRAANPDIDHEVIAQLFADRCRRVEVDGEPGYLWVPEDPENAVFCQPLGGRQGVDGWVKVNACGLIRCRRCGAEGDELNKACEEKP